MNDAVELAFIDELEKIAAKLNKKILAGTGAVTVGSIALGA